MASLFKPAQRSQSKLRLAIDGPSGCGKTLSSLLIAYGITGDWSKIAVIDTERGSANLYVGTEIANIAVGQYAVVTMPPPYNPLRYVELIRAAEIEGFEVVVIDSLSHAWSGEGGALEMVDAETAASKSHNAWSSGWRTVTPKHRKLIDAITGSPIHVIATMRTKTEWVPETSKGGKVVPRKIGLKPDQREGTDYEFTVQLTMDKDTHIASAQKDRTGIFDGTPAVPTVDTGRRLAEWLNAGVAQSEPIAADPRNDCLNELRSTLDGHVTNLRKTGFPDDEVAAAKAAVKSVCTKYKPAAQRGGWITDLTNWHNEFTGDIDEARADYALGGGGVCQVCGQQSWRCLCDKDADRVQYEHDYLDEGGAK